MRNNLNGIKEELGKLIKAYEIVIKGIEEKAQHSKDRAYGGIIRVGKGKLVEGMSARIVERWHVTFLVARMIGCSSIEARCLSLNSYPPMPTPIYYLPSTSTEARYQVICRSR